MSMNRTKHSGRMSSRKKRIMGLEMFLGLLLAIVVLAPIAWMFLSSVMQSVDLTAKPLKLIPETITFERYRQIFQSTTTSDPAFVFRIALKNSFTLVENGYVSTEFLNSRHLVARHYKELFLCYLFMDN